MGQLSLRHELFAREYVKANGNGSAAYRKVYPGVKWYATPRRAAWRLIHKHPKVSERIKELRARMIKKSDITIDRILNDYEQAKSMAIEQEKPADLVNAATAQAKLVGLLKDRVENTNINFDGIDDISEILQIVANEAGSDIAAKLGEALNVLPKAEIVPPEASASDLEALPSPTKAVN